MNRRWLLATLATLLGAQVVFFGGFPAGRGSVLAQSSILIEEDVLDALITETSGEMGLNHFAHIVANYSGFSPSLGAERTAEYIAGLAREWGLEEVTIEKFPSDGKLYYGTFLSEPWWEARKAEVWLVEPEKERIASFDVYRGHLARFSQSANVKTELVDVGRGIMASDYEGKNVDGKIVLASGPAAGVHSVAVWEQGAAGVISYRTANHLTYPDLIGSSQLAPRRGPNGEPAAFVINVSYRSGRRLAQRLAEGEKLVVQADIETETGAGEYPQVHAVVKGTEPELSEVWIQAHTNYRNTGGGNNLTGVGATLDLARSLATLVEEGKVPRPRRNIRFTWGAEHTATMYYFQENPDAVDRVLAYLDLDMVGDHQHLSQSILRLYRTPHSVPSFINDITQEMFETIHEGNIISIRHGGTSFASKFLRPVVDPAGSDDQFFYRIEDFWGPSDHEDVATLGVHAVLLNTWPDPFIGTQEDTKERADATQMKRASVITGAAALVMSSAGSEEIPALVQNALVKARARLAEEERRAIEVVRQSESDRAAHDYRQAINVIREAYRVEGEALNSLTVFAEDDDARSYLEQAVTNLMSAESDALKRLDDDAASVAESRGWGTMEPARPAAGPTAALVPVRTAEIRGPVNIFRHQYGQDWLKEKLQDPDFLGKIALARRGRYVYYEVLNFVDGELSLGEIRDRVSAEYGPVPLEEVEEYLRLMEEAGVVRFTSVTSDAGRN